LANIYLNDLLEKGLIFKDESGSWCRNCPQCNQVIKHSGTEERRFKSTCVRACIKKNLCRDCISLNATGKELKPIPNGVWKNEQGNWCRNCPRCNKTLKCKGKNKNKVKNKCVSAHKNHRLCAKCAQYIKIKPIPDGVQQDDLGRWTRNCPKCDKLIVYKNHEWAKYACVSGFNKEKFCKDCVGEITSTRQTGCKRSPETCRKIGDSKRGDKNPYFGKKRSAEFCKMSSEANKGEKNPWWGKKKPPELVHKMVLANQKSKYQRKDYTLPNGEVISVQGYEPQTIDYLLKEINQKDIDIGADKVPIIKYNWKDKDKLYYPDCFLNKLNTLIETKSDYTWFADQDRNKAKIKASIQSGYNLRLIIWKNKKDVWCDVTFSSNSEIDWNKIQQTT